MHSYFARRCSLLCTSSELFSLFRNTLPLLRQQKKNGRSKQLVRVHHDLPLLADKTRVLRLKDAKQKRRMPTKYVTNPAAIARARHAPEQVSETSLKRSHGKLLSGFFIFARR